MTATPRSPGGLARRLRSSRRQRTCAPPLPRLANNGEHRLLITETETYLREEIDGDPSFESSPLDRTRSRIVYTDEFDLPSH